MADSTNNTNKKFRKQILSRYDDIVNIVSAIDDDIREFRYDRAVQDVEQLIEDSSALVVVLERASPRK